MRRHKKNVEGAHFKFGRIVRSPGGRWLWLLGVVVMVGCCVGFAVRAYTRRSAEPVASLTSTGPSSRSASTQKASASSSLFSRLRFQPAADGMRRRLGRRFSTAGLEESVLAGTLTIRNNPVPIRITRTQDGDGEQVEIALNGEPVPLRWNSSDGATAGAATATSAQRSITERLTLDSAEQFIFAQLRGAAYNTVARDIRPAEAGDSDDYGGPVWDLVRVVESTSLSKNRPQSAWRIYYLNTSTGLIDKILSREDDDNVIAQLSSWVDQGGELVPTRITWTRNKQLLMELSISHVSLNAR